MLAVVNKTTIAELEAYTNFGTLLELYADESAVEGFPNPRGDWDLYRAIEQAGFMHPFSATIDGELVGFANVMASLNPHSGVMLAATESLFVHPEFRSSGAGAQLISACQACAAEVGSPKLFVTAAIGSQLEKYLAGRKDAKLQGKVYLLETK